MVVCFGVRQYKRGKTNKKTKKKKKTIRVFTPNQKKHRLTKRPAHEHPTWNPHSKNPSASQTFSKNRMKHSLRQPPSHLPPNSAERKPHPPSKPKTLQKPITTKPIMVSRASASLELRSFVARSARLEIPESFPPLTYHPPPLSEATNP